MKSKLEPNYNWRNWRLIIAEEFETWHADGIVHSPDDNSMCGNYPPNSFVYLWNNTIQIVVPVIEERDRYKGRFIYEIDLDRYDEIDWLEHLSHKNWCSFELIMSLASAARRIGKLKNIKDKKYWDCWSEKHALRAAAHASDSDNVFANANCASNVLKYRDIITNLMANVSAGYNGRDFETIKQGFITAKNELSEIGNPYLGHPSIKE